ncbi:MAG: hypothetical protein HRT89_17940, partial [Lentisphaeria bacterium]|nr:hypothetical protein [Lentisphaeria bacterium]NQZ69940.1 hypothetical protein [Lentisphaeria bacterium]
ILGSSYMLFAMFWGSVFVALIVRYTVLFFGGAVTVKEKLMPFAVGMFSGSLCAFLIISILAFYFGNQGLELKLLIP